MRFFLGSFFFFWNKAKDLPFSLIKKKRIARLINGNPGENRHNTPTQRAHRPTWHPQDHTHRRGEDTVEVACNVIVITSPRAGDSDFGTDDPSRPLRTNDTRGPHRPKPNNRPRRRGPAAPILLMRFAGESCKPCTNLVQRNLWRAPSAETTLMESSSLQRPCRPQLRLLCDSQKPAKAHQRCTGPSTQEGQDATPLCSPPSSFRWVYWLYIHEIFTCTPEIRYHK